MQGGLVTGLVCWRTLDLRLDPEPGTDRLRADLGYFGLVAVNWSVNPSLTAKPTLNLGFETAHRWPTGKVPSSRHWHAQTS